MDWGDWDDWDLDRAFKALTAGSLCIIACLVAALAFCSPVSFRPTFNPKFDTVIKAPPPVVTVVAHPTFSPKFDTVIKTPPAAVTVVESGPPPTPFTLWPPFQTAVLIAGTFVLLSLLWIVRELIKKPEGVFGNGPESDVSRLAVISALVAGALPQLGEALGDLKYLVSVAGGALALAPLVLRFCPKFSCRLVGAVGVVAVLTAICVGPLFFPFRVIDPTTHEWPKSHQMQSGWTWFHEHVANLQPDAWISICVIIAVLLVNIAVAVWTGKAPTGSAGKI